MNYQSDRLFSGDARAPWRLLFGLPLLAALMCHQAGTQELPSTTQVLAGPAAVPHLVKFNGSVKDVNGKPLTGVAGITFALDKDEQAGAPLWLETQNVQLDASGRYSVQLGATKPQGLPTELFASGEARWLGVQPSGQAEQPRVLLNSVPYALKAVDAETLGGLPPSAFMHVKPPSAGSANSPDQVQNRLSTSPIVHGSGSPNFLPICGSDGKRRIRRSKAAMGKSARLSPRTYLPRP